MNGLYPNEDPGKLRQQYALVEYTKSTLVSQGIQPTDEILKDMLVDPTHAVTDGGSAPESSVLAT